MSDLLHKGPRFFFTDMVPVLTPEAVAYVASFAAFEALLQVFWPANIFRGPVTAGGNTPVYKARAACCSHTSGTVQRDLYSKK